MKNFVKLLALLGLFTAAPAFSQQIINCIQVPATPCNTVANPGTGNQGDPAWLAFGKDNTNWISVYTFLGNLSAVPIASGGTGANTATAAINALLPGQTGFSGDCLGTNGVIANWTPCGTGGGSPAFSSVTSGTNTVASLIVGTGASLAPTGSGVVTANALASGYTVPAGSGGTGATSLAAAGIPVINSSTAGHCVTWSASAALGDAGAPCASSFIPGTFTSTQIIASYPPASNAGASALTTDMGRMTCDGVRWNVVGTPPIPPGAALLGYTHNAYTDFPVFADLVFSRGTTKANWYAGIAAYSGQPTSAAFGTDSGTGQLALYYTSGNAAVMTITASQNTTNITGLLGKLPPAIGSKGFYFEAAYTIPTDNADSFDALFVQPWQHNAAKGDEPGSPFPAAYEQWHEFDINENGHGTDQSGFLRGTYINWGGSSSPGIPVTCTVAPSTGAHGCTLTAPWAGDSQSTFNAFTTSSQNLYPATLTNGSTTMTWGPALTCSPCSASLTAGAYNVLVQTAQTGAIIYTTEHIFGGAYDPVGQKFYVWLDGTLVETYSTAVTGTTNTFRDSLGYQPILQTASHGALTAGTMLVRYVAMWTP
jgi:hypothetical protein